MNIIYCPICGEPEPIDSKLFADIIEFLKDVDRRFEDTDAPLGIRARKLLQQIEETA